MSELKALDETCPFCGKVYPGKEQVEYEDWWRRRSACTSAASNARTGHGTTPSVPSAPEKRRSETVNEV